MSRRELPFRWMFSEYHALTGNQPVERARNGNGREGPLWMRRGSADRADARIYISRLTILDINVWLNLSWQAAKRCSRNRRDTGTLGAGGTAPKERNPSLEIHAFHDIAQRL